MRAALVVGLLACFMVALFWLMTQTVPEANRDLVTYMLGQLSIMAGGAVAYYFGTTLSSQDKTDRIAGMLPPPPPPAPSVQDVHVVNDRRDPVPTDETTTEARRPLDLTPAMEEPQQ